MLGYRVFERIAAVIKQQGMSAMVLQEVPGISLDASLEVLHQFRKKLQSALPPGWKHEQHFFT